MASKDKPIVLDDDETQSNNHGSKRRKLNHGGSVVESDRDPRKHPWYSKLSQLMESRKRSRPHIMLSSPSAPSNDVTDVGQLKRHLRELTEKLMILRRMATNSGEPEYGVVGVQKQRASRGMALLKQRLMMRFNAQFCTVQMVKVDSGEKKYKKCITEYLQKNKCWSQQELNADNPWIACSRDGSEWKRQRDLLSLEQQEMDRDNLYVSSKRDIVKHVVIGEYNGIHLTVPEYNEIYEHSAWFEQANLFAFDVDLDEEDLNEEQLVKQEHEASDAKNEGDNDGDGDEAVLVKTIEDIRQYNHVFVLDPIGYQHIKQMDHLLMFCGDIRDDPLQKRNDNREAEKRRLNIKMVTVKVNGFPRIFVCSNRAIKKGESLRANFGDEFTKAKYQAIKAKLVRTRITTFIDGMLDTPFSYAYRDPSPIKLDAPL